MNKDGQIDGNELLQLAELLLKISLVDGTIPTKVDIMIEKDRMLQRFDKGPYGSLILREMALLYEEAEVFAFDPFLINILTTKC